MPIRQLKPGAPGKSNTTNNAMGRRDHYHVYVIELSKDVLFEYEKKGA
jgi:hypothetical protein